MKFCFLLEKTFFNETGRSRDTFKKASKSVCISTVVVSPDFLSLTQSISSYMKTPQSTGEDSDDP